MLEWREYFHTLNQLLAASLEVMVPTSGIVSVASLRVTLAVNILKP